MTTSDPKRPREPTTSEITLKNLTDLNVTCYDISTKLRLFTGVIIKDYNSGYALTIGHFRISLNLFLKSSLGAHPFI